MFVTKLNASGTGLVYSSYIGNNTSYSSDWETGTSIAVDDLGNCYIAGAAGTAEFPILNAVQPSFGGVRDAFVAKLNPAGSGFVYSTFLGGSGQDIATGIAVDARGNAYVTGSTNSVNFPVSRNAYQTTYIVGSCSGGCTHGFVAKLDPAGSALLYSTLLEGSSSDLPAAIAVDLAGGAYITGTTCSADFPTTPAAFQKQLSASASASRPCSDAFVTKLRAEGSLDYSTFLGGSDEDRGQGIAVGRDGTAYVTGTTRSRDFPLMAPFQNVNRGDRDAFVSRLNAAGSAALYSTYLGGSGNDFGNSIALDSSGNIYLTGVTDSLDYPTLDPIQPANSGGRCALILGNFSFGFTACTDAFVTKLNPFGSGLIYSTYLGGDGNDAGAGIAVGSDGSAYVTGTSLSGAPNFPLLPGTQSSLAGVFVSKIVVSGHAPAFSAASITNAASFTTGFVPGSIITIFGSHLNNAEGILVADRFPLPTELNGTVVKINGIPAPLLGVANVNGQQQINLVVPFEIRFPATVIITNNGILSVPIRVDGLPFSPGIFTLGGTSGAIQHSADFSLVTPSNSARSGEVLIIYATGLGPVEPPVDASMPAPASPPSRTVNTPIVAVNGVPAEVLFSGLAPGYAGLYQVNIRVPAGLSSGEAKLAIQSGTQASNVVTVPVL